MTSEYCKYECWQDQYPGHDWNEVEENLDIKYEDVSIIDIKRTKVIALLGGRTYEVPERYLTDPKYRKSYKYDVAKAMREVKKSNEGANIEIKESSDLDRLKLLIDKHRDKACRLING